VIEGMKTENEPDEKEPIPDYMKPEVGEIKINFHAGLHA